MSGVQLGLFRLCGEAFVFLREAPARRSRSISGDRATLEGAARVRIDEDLGDGRFAVTVLAASPRWYDGRRMEFSRRDLFVTREERRHFEALVRYFWGNAPHPGPRPEPRDA